MNYILYAISIIAFFFFLFIILKIKNSLVERIENKFDEVKNSFIKDMNDNKENIERTKDIISQNTIKTLEMIKDLSTVIEKLTNEQKYATQLSEDLKYLFVKPKSRGIYSEFLLEEMLDRFFPKKLWHKQFTLKGEDKNYIMDFAIDFKNTIIPIDVKFPIEDYNRYINEENEMDKQKKWDEFLKKIKQNIRDISSKYVKPSKGTSDFAIMFVPSDAIYFEAISESNILGYKSDIMDYMQNFKVLLCGPSILYAFLQIMVMGLRNIEVFENAKDIISNIKILESDLRLFYQKYEDVEKHLNSTVSSYNISKKHYDKIKKSSDKIISIDDDKNNEQEINKE